MKTQTFNHKSDCAQHNEPYMKNGSCDCRANVSKIMNFFKTTIDSMERLEVNISAPTNCVIDMINKTVEFSEYGEHIMTISIDDLQNINTSYITGHA